MKNKIIIALAGSRYQNLNDKSGKNKKGFTLVELLVVISIIGILSSLSTVSVNVARERARDARRKSDMAQVQLALYLYFDDNLRFPDTPSQQFQANGDFWIDWLTPNLNGSISGQRKYMSIVPTDPLGFDELIYHYNSDGKTFVLSYYLEEGGPKEFHGY